MLRFHAIGDWRETEVVVEWSNTSGRLVVPGINTIIEAAWDEVRARPGVRLFDGPMCRLESWSIDGATLRLRLSPTSYKVFLGTNLSHPELETRYGTEVMANPVGVSALVETSDGVLLLGRRNASVAYYPSRIHPFAGALEPRDGTNPFDAVRRELSEEIGLTPAAIDHLCCAGMVEDCALRQPELIFVVRAALPVQQIDQQLDQQEHHATFRVAADASAIETALAERALTPVAVGSLLLWGKMRFGAEWFVERSAMMQRT